MLAVLLALSAALVRVRRPEVPLCSAVIVVAKRVLALSVLPVVGAVTEAEAAPMDPALGRLVLAGSCEGRPVTCRADDGAFRELVAQFGAALEPGWVGPARTLGLAGLELGLQSGLTSLDRGRVSLRRGTRGDGEKGEAVSENRSPPGWLQQHSLVVQKGLGLGGQAAALVGWVPETRFRTFAGRLSVAPLEGFDSGRWAWVPDVAAAGTLWSAAGSPELRLSGAVVDVRASKGWIWAHAVALTPWVGASASWLWAESERVDFTLPSGNLEGCDYQGLNYPRTGGAEPFDGGVLCGTAEATSVLEAGRFAQALVRRARAVVGGSLEYSWWRASIQLTGDIVPVASPSGAFGSLTGLCAGGAACSASRQWSLGAALSAGF